MATQLRGSDAGLAALRAACGRWVGRIYPSGGSGQLIVRLPDEDEATMIRFDVPAGLAGSAADALAGVCGLLRAVYPEAERARVVVRTADGRRATLSVAG